MNIQWKKSMFYYSFVLLIFFLIFIQFLGWELYPNQDFSVLRLLIKK
jgi:hypothetical protein